MGRFLFFFFRVPTHVLLSEARDRTDHVHGGHRHLLGHPSARCLQLRQEVVTEVVEVEIAEAELQLLKAGVVPLALAEAYGNVGQGVARPNLTLDINFKRTLR